MYTWNKQYKHNLSTACKRLATTFLCLLCRHICRRVSSIWAINICMYVCMYVCIRGF